MTRARAVTSVLFLIWALGVLVLTFPIPSPRPSWWWAPPWWQMVELVPFRVEPVSMVLNVVMFVPLGILAPLLWRWPATVRRVFLLGLAVSTGIELIQLLFLITADVRRTVDVNDLIANSAGALIGCLILTAAQRAVHPRTPAGRLR